MVSRLVVPLLLELSLGLMVGMAGTVWAASISDAGGGSFALANHVFGLMFMVFRLVGAGKTWVPVIGKKLIALRMLPWHGALGWADW